MLFKSYYEPLCHYAYSFLQDRDEAEEIVQTAFLNLWEKRDQINIRVSQQSYLYTMVRNTCLNVLKHGRIKQKHATEALATAEIAYDSTSEEVVSSELAARIGGAIANLPEQCRRVFTLSRYEELSYAEIANQLNISIKTVENQIGKALRMMRQELKEYLPALLWWACMAAGLTLPGL